MNIKTEPVKDLIFGLLNRENTIFQIIIDGKTEFDKNDVYPSDAEIELLANMRASTDARGCSIVVLTRFILRYSHLSMFATFRGRLLRITRAAYSRSV